VLKKLSEMMSDDDSNFSTLVTLHIDEINIFARHLFRSHKCIFGPAHNERNSLADSMLVFLMSTLTGKKLSINLCSKPVKKLKNECLHDLMLKCLDKATECNFEIVPIIMDCHATNVKVMKKVLILTNPVMNNAPTPVARMKFETSFMHNNNERFIMFCVPHMLKSFRNGLFSSNNYYQYPRLVLSTGFVLEAGTCTVSWVRKLYHENCEGVIVS